MKYEVWAREEWGTVSGLPDDSFMTIDYAMDKVKSLSKDGHVYFVWEKGSPSRVRGFGINGQWKDAKDHCKSCNNSTYNYRTGETCRSCDGTSWKPYR